MYRQVRYGPQDLGGDQRVVLLGKSFYWLSSPGSIAGSDSCRENLA